MKMSTVTLTTAARQALRRQLNETIGQMELGFIIVRTDENDKPLHALVELTEGDYGMQRQMAVRMARQQYRRNPHVDILSVANGQAQLYSWVPQEA